MRYAPAFANSVVSRFTTGRVRSTIACMSGVNSERVELDLVPSRGMGTGPAGARVRHFSAILALPRLGCARMACISYAGTLLYHQEGLVLTLLHYRDLMAY